VGTGNQIDGGFDKGFFRSLLKPLSYLVRARPVKVDTATWDMEYEAGKWKTRFEELTEMPRYAVIAGYSMTINPAASVLDIGCGAGHLWSWLRQESQHRYLGVDISGVAIQQARQRALSSRAEFRVGNATTFTPDDRFDVIVFNEVLYYLTQPELALQRYENFLTPKGVFVVSMCRSAEALRTWRRCTTRLNVLDEVRVSSSNALEWHVWLCRPNQTATDTPR
jgi:2-polyprenyl-3-methyl-5-hydroxy-6-metoxy-1,4-benzoquinol methylase